MTDHWNDPFGYLKRLVQVIEKRSPEWHIDAQRPASNDTEKQKNGSPSLTPSDERQLTVPLTGEIPQGPIAALQAALRSGWRLAELEVQDASTERRLAFVLRREKDVPRRPMT